MIVNDSNGYSASCNHNNVDNKSTTTNNDNSNDNHNDNSKGPAAGSAGGAPRRKCERQRGACTNTIHVIVK